MVQVGLKVRVRYQIRILRVGNPNPVDGDVYELKISLFIDHQSLSGRCLFQIIIFACL